AIVTKTTGKEMSGFAVMGRRTKLTKPMNNRTTNSTIGGSGWRMAHAEMFLIGRLSCLQGAGGCVGVALVTRTDSPSCRKLAAVVTTRSEPLRPDAMTTPSSEVSATRTGRLSARPSELTMNTYVPLESLRTEVCGTT